MLTFPSQWHFSEIKKFLIDIGNAQWVESSGIDEHQEAFELYEHLITPTKSDDVKPDSNVGKPDA
jgi:hypothetical protein